MKKTNVRFGGGSSSVLFSVRGNKFFCYEQESSKLHSNYGGHQYYKSVSGKSGAGYLTDQGDLIEFGWYRTDAKNEQQKMIVHRTESGKKIFGYAPTRSHEGFDSARPVILTDGYRVSFSCFGTVLQDLLNWGNLEFKPLQQRYYLPTGEEKAVMFELHNPNHFAGVRATRFVDLREARKETVSAGHPTRSMNSVFASTLGIAHIKDSWYHLSQDGLFDVKWESDPREIVGEIVCGWTHAGDGLYFRRAGHDVSAFSEVRRDTFAGGRYDMTAAGTEEFLHYEQNFTVLEFFSRTVKHWKQHFLAALTAKAREEYVWARKNSATPLDVRQMMADRPHVTICIQDSLDCGNCLPGTEAFVARFGIQLVDGCISAGGLLSHSRIDELLSDPSFARVVATKLVATAE